MSIMKGKLIQTLNTQTVRAASVGLARKSTSPNPRLLARTGIGLEEVATSQFQDVAETTTGTTQGSSSRTLNTPVPGILVRISSARARPMAQLPKTPARVKMTVNWAAFQKAGSPKALVKLS